MATKNEIILAINLRIKKSPKPAYKSWAIGITHDLTARRQWHEDRGESTKHWSYWQAASLSDAQDIESHFINSRNMKGGTGGDMDARKTTYVYIF